MSDELIRLENISVIYGRITALRNLNLSIYKGDYVGIIGPNGSGKSTLLKTILGLTKTSEGEIFYNGDIQGRNSIRMGYVPQTSDINRFFPITVLEVVLTGRLKSEIVPMFRYSEDDKQEALAMLDLVGLIKQKDRQISDLSGGEFQKMLIARSLIMKPDILLLDEPTTMVDALSQKQILTLIKRLSKDITILIVTHQVQTITKQVKKLLYLEKNVLAEGDPEEVYKYAYLKPVNHKINESNYGGN
jgi:zinc transport system ATP-binding protein